MTSTAKSDQKSNAQKVLVTGGAGFIGSHTAVVLQQSGYKVAVVDNFANSRPCVIDRIGEITGTAPRVFDADVQDTRVMQRVFAEFQPEIVIHFAALKSVGESVEKPLEYYRSNLGGLINIIGAAQESGCSKIIFSSSATVYGEPQQDKITASHTVGDATNPYGWTKIFGEQILQDAAKANPGLQVIALRYFNPVGAHPSGLIGEDPKGVPANLVAFTAKVAADEFEKVTIFGDDYDTPDGTGVRDYIHVMDLASGHRAAIDGLAAGFKAVNLGSGRGYSVKEVIAAYSHACGQEVPYEVGPRRPGDLAEVIADPSLAHELLGWQTEKDLDQMCADSWRFASKAS